MGSTAEEGAATVQERELAGFSDRVVAFSVDVGMFYAGYYLSHMLAFAGSTPGASDRGTLWFAAWAALFIVYQAYCSCEGRVSLGKKLLGLRVVDTDNEPLSLGKAVIRSVTYLLSSVLSLGFLWSLVNSTRQCWHDLVVGSLVVADAPRSDRGRVLARVAAAGCLAFFGLHWMWLHVWAPRYYQKMSVAYAQVGLSEIAQLEKAYFDKRGRYSDSLISLATVSGDPERFLKDMAALFDLEAGFEIKTTAKGFTVYARSNDSRRTLLTISGP
ncbi:MAG: RDD family protein [Elusimicrobia bacterium]|nr:RDD family protein [Elusimicrobiota bacterium]